MVRPDETLYWDDGLSDHGGGQDGVRGSLLCASGDGTGRWLLDVEFAPDIDVDAVKDAILTALQP